MRIVQIVPRIAPSKCGVGDHALALARKLRSNEQIETTFVSCAPGDPKPNESVQGFDVIHLRSQTSQALNEAIELSGCQKIVLHYSGYGYSLRGAPFWLASGLSGSCLRVVTMFHELYASGPVTSSAFWLSPAMRWIARRLARLSSSVITNREESAMWLRGDVSVLPVFSNFGESSSLKPFDSRMPWLLSFPYQAVDTGNYWRELQQSAVELGVKKIFTLGASRQIANTGLNQIETEDWGIRSGEEIKRLMVDCRFGALSYNPRFLGKSSIFASFATHGLCTVLLEYPLTKLGDGLSPDRHVVSPGRLNGIKALSSVGQSAYEWYQTHSLAAAAKLYAEKLQ